MVSVVSSCNSMVLLVFIPQFLAREIYPTMIKSMARLKTQVNKEARIEDSFTVQANAADTFTSDRDINRYLTTVSATVGEDGKTLGYRGAWDKFQEMVTGQVASGTLDLSDVNSHMANQDYPCW